jgi:hypothetical protein
VDGARRFLRAKAGKGVDVFAGVAARGVGVRIWGLREKGGRGARLWMRQGGL